MKFKLSLVFILGISQFLYSCDICGCAASSFSLGILPNSNYHFINLRHSYRNFYSSHPPLFGKTEPGSNELFQSTELIGRWKINRRFQLLGILPFSYNMQEEVDQTRSISGLGDISVLGNVVFISTTDSLSKMYKQTGTVGIGLKMPTGTFRNTQLENRNMQLGTGSWDIVSNVNYSIQKGSWGLMHESSYTIKTENPDKFKFGNAFSTTNLLFYRWNINANMKLIPQVGVTYSHNDKDKINGKFTDLSFSGGSLLNAQVNLSLMYKKVAFTIFYGKAITYHLGDGYVTPKENLRFSLHYFIQKKNNN